MTTKKQLRRQACLAKFLSGFDFVIFYTLNKENRKTKLLICWPNDYPADD